MDFYQSISAYYDRIFPTDPNTLSFLYSRVRPGSRILDIACGTGLNFKLIANKLAEEGKLVGVDLSPGMLKVARKRIERHRWKNVQVVNMSIIDFQPETQFDAAICTFAMEAMPDYQGVVDHIFDLLKPQGRFKHLFKPENEGIIKQFQEDIDKEWDRLHREETLFAS